MKYFLLITYCFIGYSTCYSQYFIGYENSLGAIFEHKPYGGYIIDTNVISAPHQTTKMFQLNSVNQYSKTENLLLGENNIRSPYYNKNVPVRLWFTGGFKGVNKLLVDTNGVLFDSLTFNQSTNPKIDTTFQISNRSTITARITNPDSNQNYYGTINLQYDSLVKISVTSSLPSRDTVFIDENSNSFPNIPDVFVPIDTNTVKRDSLMDTKLYVTDNSTGKTWFFRNTLPYNEYYYSFTVFVSYPFTATLSLKLDTINLYNGVYLSSYGAPYINHYVINDTVAMDSNSTLSLHLGRGNNSLYITSERFKTETRISIKQTIGLKSNKLNDQVVIYPNPVNDYLKIVRDNDKSLKFQIYSVDGKLLLFDDEIINNSINLKKLKKGVYLIVLPELGVRKKIIKN